MSGYTPAGELFDPEHPSRCALFHDGMATDEENGEWVPWEDYEKLLKILKEQANG